MVIKGEKRIAEADMKDVRISTIKTPVPHEDVYLGLKDLARYCRLSPSTLRSYLNHAHYPLPHFRVGGKILVKKGEFDKWIENFRCKQEKLNLDKLVDEVMQSLRNVTLSGGEG